MTTIPNYFQNVSEPIIASYDWRDYIIKQGYVSLYPTFCYNKGVSDNLLLSGSENSIAQYAAGTERYFLSAPFKKPVIIEGQAFFNYYFDYSAASSVITADLWIQDVSNTSVAFQGSGSNVTVTSGTAVKTHDVTGLSNFVYYLRPNNDLGQGAEVMGVYVVWKYEDGTQYTTSEAQWTGILSTNYCYNPITYKKVTGFEVWGRIVSGSSSEHINYSYYGYSSWTRTLISDTNNSGTLSADGGGSLVLNLTRTLVTKNKLIVLRVSSTGASGVYYTDPTSLTYTKPTMSVDIPFKIDL